MYREMVVASAIEGNTNIYNKVFGLGVPLSGTTTVTTAETLLPLYGSVIADSMPAKNPMMKAESGLTYNIPASRKRTRDSINLLSYQKDISNRCSPFSFLGEDLSLQIQQQQFEIDRFIAQHTEKVRLEVEERRKQQSRRLIAAVEEGITKRLKAKEEEIEKIGKLNWALEERVKSLCIENQIWRDLAQTNEATANALRTNLEQVLSQVKDVHHSGAGLDDEAEAAAAALTDDAQSCCGSSGGVEERCTLAGSRGEREWAKDKEIGRWCRNCGKEESCVLLLPCRHLCLCTVCGATLHTCPVCKSNKNASVHVNMS